MSSANAYALRGLNLSSIRVWPSTSEFDKRSSRFFLSYFRGICPVARMNRIWFSRKKSVDEKIVFRRGMPVDNRLPDGWLRIRAGTDRIVGQPMYRVASEMYFGRHAPVTAERGADSGGNRRNFRDFRDGRLVRRTEESGATCPFGRGAKSDKSRRLHTVCSNCGRIRFESVGIERKTPVQGENYHPCDVVCDDGSFGQLDEVYVSREKTRCRNTKLFSVGAYGYGVHGSGVFVSGV